MPWLKIMKGVQYILDYFKTKSNQGGTLINVMVLGTVLSILMLSMYNINAQNIAEVEINQFMLQLNALLDTISPKYLEYLNEIVIDELENKTYIVTQDELGELDELTKEDIAQMVLEDIRTVIQQNMDSSFSWSWYLADTQIYMSASLYTAQSVVDKLGVDGAFIYLLPRVILNSTSRSSTAIFGITDNLEYEIVIEEIHVYNTDENISSDIQTVDSATQIPVNIDESTSYTEDEIIVTTITEITIKTLPTIILLSEY